MAWLRYMPRTGNCKWRCYVGELWRNVPSFPSSQEHHLLT